MPDEVLDEQTEAEYARMVVEVLNESGPSSYRDCALEFRRCIAAGGDPRECQSRFRQCVISGANTEEARPSVETPAAGLRVETPATGSTVETPAAGLTLDTSNPLDREYVELIAGLIVSAGLTGSDVTELVRNALGVGPRTEDYISCKRQRDQCRLTPGRTPQQCDDQFNNCIRNGGT